MKIRIRKGDTVRILRGKDRGKTGRVERVNTKDLTVVVEGLNLIKRHLRRRANSRAKAGIQTQPAPMAISKLMVLCPQCAKPTRVRVLIDDQGVRHRVCLACKQMFTETAKKTD